MNGYLVLLQHTMDDLPVRLFSHTKRGMEEALVFAGGLKPMPSARIRKFYNTDCSTPVRSTVIEFLDGVPHRNLGSMGLG